MGVPYIRSLLSVLSLILAVAFILMVSIEKALALKSVSNLASDEISQRILDESDGVIGYMMTLLQMLAERAIRNRSECITLDDISPTKLIT